MALVISIGCFSHVKVAFLFLFIFSYGSKLILAEENERRIFGGDPKTEKIEPRRRSCDVKPCLVICPPENVTEANDTRIVENKDAVNFDGIPDVYLTNLTRDPEDNKTLERFQIVEWYPCEDRGAYFLNPAENPTDEYYLLRDGSLLLPKLERDKQVTKSGDYCFRRNESDSSYTPEVCSPQQEDKVLPNGAALHYVGFLISVPCLIATIIVYSILTELKNLYGTTLKCYLYCLVFTYLSLLTDGIKPKDYSAGVFCLFVGYTIYFSFLASSFWLNVMCFDMWRRFGGSELIHGTNYHRCGNRFLVYSVYAWGCPIVLTAMCIGMDFTPEMPDSVVRPGLLENACWFAQYAGGLYFYTPMAILIACNICLFVATSLKMVLHNRQMRLHLINADSQRHDDKRIWFGLYVKLFVVMGITWSAEVISYVYETPRYLWYVTDMINALQGLFVFVIFVCKRRIWISLKNWFKTVRATRRGCVLPNSKSTSTSDSTNTSFAGQSSHPNGVEIFALKQMKKSSR